MCFFPSIYLPICIHGFTSAFYFFFDVHRYAHLCMGDFLLVLYVHASPCDCFMKLNLYGWPHVCCVYICLYTHNLRATLCALCLFHLAKYVYKLQLFLSNREHSGKIFEKKRESSGQTGWQPYMTASEINVRACAREPSHCSWRWHAPSLLRQSVVCGIFEWLGFFFLSQFPTVSLFAGVHENPLVIAA